ncbi:MAG TPA: hypothetical protein VMF67_17945 [Rhizomicrobium sp.]|nr:hypothetical protein [Rhizomicrobium sp.]
MPYKPYVPKSLSELWDYLGHMMLSSPTFKDRTGYLPRENIDTTFLSLNEGLLAVRKKLGEECYAELKAMSDKMRTLFEADPDDTTGDAQAGRKIIREMEDILRSVRKRRASK